MILHKRNKKIDDRIPKEIGEGGYESIPAVRSPWGALMNGYEAYSYLSRLSSVHASLLFEASRILIPDYDERCRVLCEASYKDGYSNYQGPMAKMGLCFFGIPPFLGGGCLGGISGDYGDEISTARGRVNDFSSYRVEKELDSCPLDIVGSELGRATTSMLQGIGDGMKETQYEDGPSMDMQMVEAKCCGDLHCRLIFENREKYPQKPHELMDCYGPVVTEDQIRFTEEENILPECQHFNPDSDYKYSSALLMQGTASDFITQENHLKVNRDIGVAFGQRILRAGVEKGLFTQEEAENVVRWVFEGAGKAMFCDPFALKGVRDWLGAPADIKDGRLLGGYIEMMLQCCRVNYEIEAFNKDEVVYRIDRKTLVWENSYLQKALVAMWHGMAKTMVGAMYACWEEQKDAPEEMIRIKIARKIDKRGS